MSFGWLVLCALVVGGALLALRRLARSAAPSAPSAPPAAAPSAPPDLFGAVHDGDEPAAAAALAAGASVHELDEDGWTPLMVAVTNSDAAMVRLLLAHGADPNMRFEEEGPGRDECYPMLHHALTSGDLEVTRLLLDAGADPNGVDGAGTAALALVVAADAAPPEAIALLLAAGARLDASGEVERAELYAAVASGRVGAARALLAAGATVRGPALLARAIADGSMPLVELLVDHGAVPRAEDLQAADRSEDTRIAAYLRRRLYVS